MIGYTRKSAMRILVAALCVLLYPASYAADQETPRHFEPCAKTGIKSSVVFLGKLLKTQEGITPSYSATGFLVSVDAIIYLVTAKHVIWDREKNALTDDVFYAFFNDKKEQGAFRAINAIKAQEHVDWIFHPNPSVDLAIIPFKIDLTNDDLRVMPSETFFEPTERLTELQDIFFFSYQPGLEVPGKIAPIARRGIISRFNEDHTFYIDAFIFPGNSGSPVFVKPNAITLLANGSIAPGDAQGCKFVGLAGEYITYTDTAFSAQTKRPRVAFEENSGLAKIWPVELLQEIFASEPFRNQHARIRSGETK